MIEFYW